MKGLFPELRNLRGKSGDDTMTTTDPIADFLNRIKTAQAAKLSSVAAPLSNLKLSIAELLKKEGFVGKIEKHGKKTKKFLEVELLYRENGKPLVAGVSRISKPSRRLYLRASEIRPVKNGFGVIAISTPKGILTGGEAKKQNVGGEPLFKIW